MTPTPKGRLNVVQHAVPGYVPSKTTPAGTTEISCQLSKSDRRAAPIVVGPRALTGSWARGQVQDEGHGFSRVPMSLRLTQGDENHLDSPIMILRGLEVVFDCAINGLRA